MQVGIASPDERLRAYPHQFSGGMRQRVAIAIALLHKPKLIVADEPTTALDVTIQGQILFEMQRLCRESNTALIWITHDLAVVAGLADRIAVMYAGRIVEMGRTADIIERPMHPYTKGLIGSVPSQNTRGHPLGADPRHDAVAAEIAGRLRLQGALPDRHRQVQRNAGAGGASPRPGRALLAGGGIGREGSGTRYFFLVRRLTRNMVPRPTTIKRPNPISFTPSGPISIVLPRALSGILGHPVGSTPSS